MLEINKIYNEECIGGMQKIDDKSIDMILCDLPYGTTARNKWDCIVPYDLLWNQYNRIIKDNGAICLFAQLPFDKTLACSNLKMLRYEWIWDKISPTGFLNAKKMPMKKSENILVFYKHLPTYNPQGLVYNPRIKKRKSTSVGSSNYNACGDENFSEFSGYPTNILTFMRESGLHSTQKPVSLCEYLIKTYTNENELVLDNTIGSGTTVIAAINTNRNYIGFELDENYYNLACKRIQEHNNKLVK